MALRHGHRRSIDFDFFRVAPFDSRDLVLTLEGAFGDLERLHSGEQTLYVRLNRVTRFYGIVSLGSAGLVFTLEVPE